MFEFMHQVGIRKENVIGMRRMLRVSYEVLFVQTSREITPQSSQISYHILLCQLQNQDKNW